MTLRVEVPCVPIEVIEVVNVPGTASPFERPPGGVRDTYVQMQAYCRRADNVLDVRWVAMPVAFVVAAVQAHPTWIQNAPPIDVLWNVAARDGDRTDAEIQAEVDHWRGQLAQMGADDALAQHQADEIQSFHASDLLAGPEMLGDAVRDALGLSPEAAGAIAGGAVGAVGGGLVGAVIGTFAGRRGRGTVIGALAGALGGAVAGHRRAARRVGGARG